jgi:hypothetical protein
MLDVNTVYDLEHLRKEKPDSAKRYLKSLLDSRFSFVKERELSDGETGLEDAFHRVDSERIPDPDDPMNPEAGTVQRRQMVLAEDPNAFLFKIGFTSAAQAQALLDSWK